MRYGPSIGVFHARRPTWRSFAAQMHKYGRGRGQLTRQRPNTARTVHFAPAGIVAYLAVAPVLVLAAPALALPIVAYVAATAAQATKVGVSLRSVRAVVPAAALLVTLHMAYGTGTLRGLLARPRPRTARRAA